MISAPVSFLQQNHEAINFHLEGLIEDGLAIPESESYAEYMLLPCLYENL